MQIWTLPLRREGWRLNHKKTCRVYHEMLQLRNKTPKRRVKAKLRDESQIATCRKRPGRSDFVPRPAGDRPQDPGADGGRHLLALLAGDRSTVQLPRRGRRAGPGEGLLAKSATRQRSASTRARSSSHAISISGLTPEA